MNKFSRKTLRKYFKSSSDFYAFCLIWLDTVNRTEMLGITNQHYRNRAIADKWYMKIRKSLTESTTLSDDDRLRASDRLEAIYARMIEK